MKHLTTLALTLTLAFTLTGCGEDRARAISETESITSVNSIDIQDFNTAANELTKQLISSGVLEQAPRRPAIMAISVVINNTQEQIDTDLLLKTIRTNLLNTGKVQTTTTVGLGGGAEDPLAKDLAAKNQLYNPNAQPPAGASPDYTLTTKIIQLASRAGNTRQSTFAFQMSLTDVRAGTAVWEGEKQITKQGKRSSVGF